MLRSFDYAIETAGLDTPRHAAGDPLPHLRAAFLDAYYDNAVGARATFLPQSRAAFDQWVSFFELDKAVYEIEYELNHRPSWAAIPMRGALRLLGAALQ